MARTSEQNQFTTLKKVMQNDPGSDFYRFVISCKGFNFIDRRTLEIVPRYLIHNTFTPHQIEMIKQGYNSKIDYRKKSEET